jgi:hypothetical protein
MSKPKDITLRPYVDCPKIGEAVPAESNCITYRLVNGRKPSKGDVRVQGSDSFFTPVFRCRFMAGVKIGDYNYLTGVRCSYDEQDSD